jgi:hypothetical protein
MAPQTCPWTRGRWGLLRLIHTYHAVLLPCHSAKGLDCVIPIWFTKCGSVWFTHAMPPPCRSHAMARTCSESDLSRSRHSAAWERHGICELASAVQRRHVGDLPAFVFFRLPRGVPRRLLPEAYQSQMFRMFPSTTRTFTKDTENGMRELTRQGNNVVCVN